MDVATDVEMEVAEILLAMPEMHARRRPLPIPGRSYWGTKSRRSALSRVVPKMARPLPSPSPPPAAPEITGPGPGLNQEVEQHEKLCPRWPPLSSSSKQCKEKGVTWKEESIEGQNCTIASTEKFLQQEKRTVEDGYESLVTEKTRLEEIKAMTEMAKKNKKKQKRRRIDHGQRHGLFTRRDGGNVSTLAVAVADPTTAHSQHEASGPRPETQPVVLAEPPPLSIPETIGDRRPVQPAAASAAQPAATTSLNIRDTAGRSAIPDLNAVVEESGSVLADWTKSRHHEQVAVTGDPRKMATAEARKKRLEICRRRRPAGGAGARIGAVTVGIITKG